MRERERIMRSNTKGHGLREIERETKRQSERWRAGEGEFDKHPVI